MKSSPRKFNIEYSASFKSLNPNNEIMVWMIEPQTSYCQEIHRVIVSPKPIKKYTDNHGNKILYFQSKNTKLFNIQMRIEATLWKNEAHLVKSNINFQKNLVPSLRQHLKNEKFLEQTPAVKKMTHKIIKNSKYPLDQINEIFNFIVKNFKYCYPLSKRGVKNLVLSNLQGDCGEYSSLFVTMCRILGIPAINRTGFVIFPKQKTVAEHGWASTYSESLGWLDFDAQYAALEKNTRQGLKKYFGQRSDYRIIFTNGFNISLQPQIPKNFKINFWKELGLPLTRRSAQTLQPLIFASKNPVRFENDMVLLKNKKRVN